MKELHRIGMIAGLVILGVIIAALATSVLPMVIETEDERSADDQPTPPDGQPPPPDGQPPPPARPVGHRQFYFLKTMFSFINIALLFPLIYLYINMYQKVKSKFTLGLLIMMSALFIYAITANPVIHETFGYKLEGLGPFMMLSDMCIGIALAILLYLSLE